MFYVKVILRANNPVIIHSTRKSVCGNGSVIMDSSRNREDKGRREVMRKVLKRDLAVALAIDNHDNVILESSDDEMPRLDWRCKATFVAALFA